MCGRSKRQTRPARKPLKVIVKKIIFTLFCLSFVFPLYAEKIPFVFHEEKGGFEYDEKRYNIIFKYDEKRHVITFDDFRSVFDWSDNYERENTGTGFVFRGRFFLFQGFLNSSMQMVYLYDMKKKKIIWYEDNISLISINETCGWALMKEAPVYSEAVLEKGWDIIINGRVLCGGHGNTPTEILWCCNHTSKEKSLKMNNIPRLKNIDKRLLVKELNNPFFIFCFPLDIPRLPNDYEEPFFSAIISENFNSHLKPN
jgi:hypothetical protein